MPSEGEDQAKQNLPVNRAERNRPGPRFATSSALYVLEELRYLAHEAGPRAGRARGYAFPSTEYLAKKAGVTRFTVSRITSRLEKLGHLQKIHRRKHRGRWRTVLYTGIHHDPAPISTVRAFLAAAKRRRAPFHVGLSRSRGSPSSRAAPPCDVDRTPSGIGESRERSAGELSGYLAEALARWKRRSDEGAG